MAIRHGLLTLSGAAQQLSAAVFTGGVPLDTLKKITLQPDPANTHVIYIGATDDGPVSSSSYGFRLEVPPSNVPAVPFMMESDGGTVDLERFEAIGTEGEKLRILVVI